MLVAFRPLVLLHAAAVCAALFGIIAPPARGDILLVPLTSTARAELVRLALDHGARLVATGPWRGSLVVRGERRALARAMLRAHVLPLRAFGGGCGERGNAR